MKKSTFLTLTVAIICVVACLFCACGGENIPFGVPVSWHSYLEEVGNCLANDIAACEDVINVNLNGSIVFNGNYYELTLRTNYDYKNYDKSGFVFVLKDVDERAVLSLITDNSNTYIDIAQNPYINNAKLKLQQTSIFDWLGGLNKNDVPQTAASVKQSFVDLGKVIFQNANVNSDKSKYLFTINGEAIGERLYGYFKSLEFIDEDILKVILSILGIRDANEIFSLLSSVEGKLIFDVRNGSVQSITSEGLSLDSDSESSVDLDLMISGEYDETLVEMFPKSDDGYKVTKVGSMTLDGAISMISSRGNKYAVKYDMSMNTNIDLLQLTFNGFDLDKLSDDNFFHFRLSHKCDSGCTEYCASRLARAKGAVLDIAYSPKDFGTSNVYVNLNLRALMRSSFVNEITRYERTVTATSIPEYGMIVLPASNLKGDNAFMRLMFEFYSTIMGIEVGDTEYVELNGMRTVFENNRVAKVLMDNIFESDEFDIDTLKIRVDENIYGQARDYDIFKEVVYLKAYDEPDLKAYGTALGKDRTAYSWTYEPEKTTKFGGETYTLNNIYDANGENLLHGVSTAGDYVPMSDKEIEDLIGSTLKLEYIGYGGSVGSAYCEIVGVDGLDATCFDVQKVTLRVKYPNLFDYSFEIGDVAERILESLFGGGSEVFVQEVSASIKLTRELKEGAFDFKSADADKKYRLTYHSSVPEFLRATATIKYENGLSKDIVTIGTSSSVIESMGWFLKQYSVVDWGRVTVKFRVAGRNVERYFDVERPDDFEISLRDIGDTMGESCNIIRAVSVKAVYGSSKVNVQFALKDLYINNICLDDPAADWEHYNSYTTKYIIFTKSNDYTVSVKKGGIDFGSFILHITSTSTQKPSYQLNISSEPKDTVMVGARNTFRGTITNKTHGNGADGEYSVDVNVYEYTVKNESMTYSEADKSIYSLDLAVGSVSSDEGKVKVVLPAMIINPVSVRLYLTINKAGIYRVTIRLNATSISLYQYILIVM